MNELEVKDLVESRGMVYKGGFLGQLTEEDFRKGMIKVNLQPMKSLDSLNGEGCWAWVSAEDKEKYDNDKSYDVIKVILANSPLDYNGILFWGSELVVQCHGNSRPTLSKKWVEEKILKAAWFGL